MNYIYRYGENDDILYPAFFERMKFVAQFNVVEKLFCISSGSFALARWRRQEGQFWILHSLMRIGLIQKWLLIQILTC